MGLPLVRVLSDVKEAHNCNLLFKTNCIIGTGILYAPIYVWVLVVVCSLQVFETHCMLFSSLPFVPHTPVIASSFILLQGTIHCKV
jgi:hypothetical protein